MATAAQIAANRANAQLSTGPTSAEGKTRSSKNNLRSGLTSSEFVVLPGQEAFFEEWITALQIEIQPCGALETDVFRQLAHASWTLHRCRQAEVQSFSNQRYEGYDILAYPVSEKALKLIDLYTRRAERSHRRALKELRTLQTERLLRDSSHPDPAPLADPRVVNKQKESTAAENATATRETSLPAPPSGTPSDSEESNPIRHGQDNAALKLASKPQLVVPLPRDQAVASEPGGSEESNPIQHHPDNGSSKVASNS